MLAKYCQSAPRAMSFRIDGLPPDIIIRIYLALDRYSALSLSAVDRRLRDVYKSSAATLLKSSLERAGKLAKSTPYNDGSSPTASEKLARLYKDEESWMHMRHFSKGNRQNIGAAIDPSLIIHDLDEGVLALGGASLHRHNINSVTCFETKEGCVVTQVSRTESEDATILGVVLSLRDYDLIATLANGEFSAGWYCSRRHCK